MYTLPVFNREYVILTAKDILTKDDTFMNAKDMYNRLDLIMNSLENDGLRDKLNNYLKLRFPEGMNILERKTVYENMVKRYPELIDYYIREKEINKEEASSISEQKVEFSEGIYIYQTIELMEKLEQESNFYNLNQDINKEAYQKVLCIKEVIEDKSGYKNFLR